ncbi:MAG: Glyceraldehyde-3-phosphate dehydrogenase (NADP+) [Candidatus Gottesmanbacteria bacterium GW2011_GWA2_41_12]|nr:MAG: Glyceraldehyde-3-phosphate dehydrogenase (NADP+) [Candidatus Gottesmanbacteria bacterium GW2011_GWA2_41_12]
MTDVISPLDGSVVGKIQVVDNTEIDEAIKIAHREQKTWEDIPLIKRVKILHLAADWLREHEHYLSVLLIKEIGKTVAEAKDEVVRSADMIDYFANEALNLRGEELSGDAFPGYDKDKLALVERVPLGVILAIAPFNYPVNLSVSKIAPALALGNAVIFKPATQGSISALHMIEAFHKAGVPAGVLSALTGGGEEIGNYLVTHPGIDQISFTGSSDVGKEIATKAGMIPLLFECGGNNPALVLSDADLDLTSTEIVKGAFSYSGQRCTAIKYVLGLAPTIDALIPMVLDKTKKLIKMGDPRKEEMNLGPVISENAAINIEKRIVDAEEKGGEILTGGKREGYYIEPTVIDFGDKLPSVDLVKKETFGPVVSFIRVQNIADALEFINSSTYGLQASVFTKDEGTGIKVGQQINVGSVQLNNKPQRGPDHFPFLGIKSSGVGVQGIRYALEAYTRYKSIVFNKPQ